MSPYSCRRLVFHSALKPPFLPQLLKRNITFLGDSVMKDFFEGFLEVFNITAEMEKQEVRTLIGIAHVNVTP